MLTADKPWMRWILRLAGAYNLLWGAFVVLFPLRPFEWVGMSPPLYPELWQCIGMIVGLYGAGYFIAASDPFRHWPIVLVGFLGKVLGPIGFALAASRERFPWDAGWTIVTNDLIWLAPFAAILIGALNHHAGSSRVVSAEVQRMALQARTQMGHTVEQLSHHGPVLVVFLRYFGCPFCREALADLAAGRQSIEAMGTRIVLVHMGSEPQAAVFFKRYRLEDLPRVSDPRRTVYRAFGLGRADFLKLLGPRIWRRGAQAMLLGGHTQGRLGGDVLQLPGTFLLFHGQVLRSFRHRTVAERPNYMQLADVEQFPI